jgi:hypothetical protein
MSSWRPVLAFGAREMRLLVTDASGSDLVKASLPLPAHHPRAMLTLVESLALWSGARLGAVISVGETSTPSAMWHDETWPPEESALVRFEYAPVRERRRRRLEGVGDFRDLRRLQLSLPWSR